MGKEIYKEKTHMHVHTYMHAESYLNSKAAAAAAEGDPCPGRASLCLSARLSLSALIVTCVSMYISQSLSVHRKRWSCTQITSLSLSRLQLVQFNK